MPNRKKQKNATSGIFAQCAGEDDSDEFDPQDGYTWPAVTRELMAGVSDENLVDVLWYYVLAHQPKQLSWKRFYNALPKGLRAVYQFRFFYGSVTNGGMHHYFECYKRWFFERGSESFRDFGAIKTSNILRKATDIYLHGKRERVDNDAGVRYCRPLLYSWDDYIYDGIAQHADFTRLTRWCRKHPEFGSLHTPKAQTSRKRSS